MVVILPLHDEIPFMELTIHPAPLRPPLPFFPTHFRKKRNTAVWPIQIYLYINKIIMPFISAMPWAQAQETNKTTCMYLFVFWDG